MLTRLLIAILLMIFVRVYLLEIVGFIPKLKMPLASVYLLVTGAFVYIAAPFMDAFMSVSQRGSGAEPRYNPDFLWEWLGKVIGCVGLVFWFVNVI